MREDPKTVRRAPPIGRPLLVILALALIIPALVHWLSAESEQIYFADELDARAPPFRALSELRPGEQAKAAALKRSTFWGIEEFVLTDQRLIRIRDRDRWSFPLARWSGFGVRTGDGRTMIRLSTLGGHEITISLAATPAAERLAALLSEAYARRPPRAAATPPSETPVPRQLRPFEHPSLGYLIWLAPLVLVLLGAWILTIALHRLRDARVRLRNQLRATGTVVDHRIGSFGSGEGQERVFHPVIEFTTLHGRKVSFESELGSGRRQALGRPVKVLYDPQAPEDAVVRGFGPLYFVPLVAGILGLAAVTWAGALVWLILSEI